MAVRVKSWDPRENLSVMVKVTGVYQREKVADAFPFRHNSWVKGEGVLIYYRVPVFEFTEEQAFSREWSRQLDLVRGMLTRQGKMHFVHLDRKMLTIKKGLMTRDSCEVERVDMSNLPEDFRVRDLWDELLERE